MQTATIFGDVPQYQLLFTETLNRHTFFLGNTPFNKYFFQGEVNVAQEDLNSFLAVAEELKVKGLTQSNTKSSPQPKHRSRDPPENESAPPPPPKRARQSNSAVNTKVKSYEPEVQEMIPNVKSEPVQPEVQSMAAVEPYQAGGEPLVEYGEDYGDYDGGYEGDAGYDDSMMDSTMTGTPSADGNKGRRHLSSARVLNLDLKRSHGKYLRT